MTSLLTRVIRHVPAGYVRTKILNAHPELSALAYRCIEPMLDGVLEPKSREVAARFNVSKDTANKALRQLVAYGYLLYRKLSGGRDRWVHVYVVTDEPWAWQIDDDLAANMARIEAELLARVDSLPAPRPVSHKAVITQVESRPEPSDPTNRDGTLLVVSKGGFSPKPPPVDESIHRSERSIHRRRPRNHTERIARAIGAIPDRLEPHIGPSLALLEALGFPPMDRVRHLPVIASALASGASMGHVQHALTTNLEGARDKRAVIGWRIGQLAQSS